MTTPSTLADGLRAGLIDHVNQTGRCRASLTTLLALQAHVEGHAATRPGARERLSTALATLREQGVIEQPRAAHLWDSIAQPALPSWITIVADVNVKASPIDMGTVAWVPAISRWVGQWVRQCRPSATLRAAVQEINNWLLAHLGEQLPPVAREERSLTIFKDEKALARVESTSLFTDGRLQPDDLAYERPVSPLRAARLADRGDLLIVENQATFDSAWRALRTTPGPFAAVAFGNGWEAAQADPVVALQHHLQLSAAPGHVYYAGDLDVDGLDIPQTLTANLTSIGFPPPTPLFAAYQTMLEQYPQGAGRAAPPAPSDLARRAVNWLSEEHQHAAGELLTRGQRVAQETLDRSWWATYVDQPASTATI
ncbi:hypothetical protein GCM10010123_20440 [Pilimelia anulata]|uniref:Wadjet protein JetD C-terminal domain-containing protein n=1 Tax=Pilimelia anulata TaxID=53371 RepID=A0A8J3B2E4_9ACTN|nr:Wadjet anti-phage system protein JetD domain-containing protein [Pilimelia anulata]GGJ90520.1 hypothetical protein GCM10010123_20440 [Pilimelia anulata]